MTPPFASPSADHNTTVTPKSETIDDHSAFSNDNNMDIDMRIVKTEPMYNVTNSSSDSPMSTFKVELKPDSIIKQENSVNQLPTTPTVQQSIDTTPRKLAGYLTSTFDADDGTGMRAPI